MHDRGDRRLHRRQFGRGLSTKLSTSSSTPTPAPYHGRIRDPARARRTEPPLSRPLSRREPVQPEQADVVAGLAVDRQVGGDLSHHAAELVAVAAAGRDDGHLRRVRQAVDDEVLVGRVREDARLEHLGRPCGIGQAALDEGAQRGLVVGPRRAVGVVRIDRLTEVVVPADLEPVPLVGREAVVAAPLDVEDEHREPFNPERLRPFGVNQPSTCRSGTASRSRAGTSSRTHAPAQITSRSASYVPAPVLTRTPSPAVSQLSTGSPKRSSAPAARAPSCARASSPRTAGSRRRAGTPRSSSDPAKTG